MTRAVEYEDGTCAVCGRKGKAYIPAGSDGTLCYPVRHKADGEVCRGVRYATVETEDRRDKKMRRNRVMG